MSNTLTPAAKKILGMMKRNPNLIIVVKGLPDSEAFILAKLMTRGIDEKFGITCSLYDTETARDTPIPDMSKTINCLAGLTTNIDTKTPVMLRSGRLVSDENGELVTNPNDWILALHHNPKYGFNSWRSNYGLPKGVKLSQLVPGTLVTIRWGDCPDQKGILLRRDAANAYNGRGKTAVDVEILVRDVPSGALSVIEVQSDQIVGVHGLAVLPI